MMVDSSPRWVGRKLGVSRTKMVAQSEGKTLTPRKPSSVSSLTVPARVCCSRSVCAWLVLADGLFVCLLPFSCVLISWCASRGSRRRARHAFPERHRRSPWGCGWRGCCRRCRRSRRRGASCRRTPTARGARRPRRSPQQQQQQQHVLRALGLGGPTRDLDRADLRRCCQGSGTAACRPGSAGTFTSSRRARAGSMRLVVHLVALRAAPLSSIGSIRTLSMALRMALPSSSAARRVSRWLCRRKS